jgi:PhnB protein
VQLNPYLTFDGQCEAAFKFYGQCLGGKITLMLTYGDSPMAAQTPPDWRPKILHTTLSVGGQILAGVDAPPESYQKPQGFSVTLNLDDPAEADRIFKAPAENGTVQMPLQATFWAL